MNGAHRSHRGAGRDRRLLVAHIVFRLDVGGLEKILLDLIRGLPAERFRHMIVCIDDFNPDFRGYFPNDVPVFPLHKGSAGTFWRLWRLLRRERPDLVHSCNLAALECQPVAALAGVRARIHAEHGWNMGDLDGANRRRRWWRWLLSPWVHRHVAVSGHLADYLVHGAGIPARRVVHIYNGVDTGCFRPDGQRPKWYPGAAEAEPAPRLRPGLRNPRPAERAWVVGTVGRLERVKDQVRLVRAFARLRELLPERFPDLRLAIIGDGPERRAVKRAVEEAGIADRAWLAGSRSDLPELLRGMDCFALPSLAEGIPVTVLEAMASGLPVVASRVGGIPELVVDGQTGALVPAADTDALARALASYARDPALGAAHGAAGRERVEGRFDVGSMVQDYAALYGEVLNGRAALTGVPPCAE